jgi:hypothetical protein
MNEEMTCDQLRDHYELYALDIAEDPERSQIRAHLSRGCEVCVPGVRRALETAALLGASASPAEPSRKLRGRILASVGSHEPRAFRWVLALAAALLVVAAYFLGTATQYIRDTGRVRDQDRALAILYGPNTLEASFGGAQPRPPRGKVFVNPAEGVLLIASYLPRTPTDKIYEMWLIPKAAKPIPAGLFQSGSDGRAMHVRPGPLDVASTAAVAVTVENQAGADQPTTTPLIVAALPATP